MSEDDQKEIVVGAPLPGGADWNFTPRAASSLNAANLKILGEPTEYPVGGEHQKDDPASASEEA